MARRVTMKTLRRILARQEPPRFLSEYQPAIRATRDEAPSRSSATIIASPKLQRDVHTLSAGETAFALLALHHPQLMDLHEQWMLPRWPADHPLVGFPGLPYQDLPSLRGTTEVADRLGYLEHLPLVYENGSPMVYPYLGDFLLFLTDEGGPYCVNWSIKLRPGDHILPGPDIPPPHTYEQLRAARARHEIEVETLRDAEIRTEALAYDSLEPVVIANLRDTFASTTVSLSLNKAASSYVRGTFQRAVDVGEAPLEVITFLVGRGVCEKWEAIHAFKAAIFNRQIRVDLFRKILMDYPVSGESTDVLERYGRWFAR